MKKCEIWGKKIEKNRSKTVFFSLKTPFSLKKKFQYKIYTTTFGSSGDPLPAGSWPHWGPTVPM